MEDPVRAPSRSPAAICAGMPYDAYDLPSMHACNGRYTRQRLEALFNQSDYDADGKLYYVEFVEALARDAPLLRAVNLGMKWK